MPGDEGGKPLMSRLWELAVFLIVLSIASQLVMTYVVPLFPYALGALFVGGIAWLILSRYRRW